MYVWSATHFVSGESAILSEFLTFIYIDITENTPYPKLQECGVDDMKKIWYCGSSGFTRFT
jgi:hypothetical protein